LRIIEEAGSASNGKIICGRCWSLEIRSARDDAHENNENAKSIY
jgi:hypothetical protein